MGGTVLPEQIEDLGLSGHVEGGRRLVGHDDVRTIGRRHGDHGPLAHPTGELVRILRGAAGCVRNPDRPQEADRRNRRRAAPHALVQAQGLADLPARAEDRVHRGHRVLEHHRDLGPAHSAHRLGRQRHEVAALERDGPSDDPSRRLDQAHQRESRHRLARSGLADDAQRLTLRQGESHSVDCPHDPPPRPELHPEVFDFQDRLVPRRTAIVHLVRRLDIERLDGAHRCHVLGSRASRSALPSRFNDTTVSRIRPPGRIASSGDW